MEIVISFLLELQRVYVDDGLVTKSVLSNLHDESEYVVRRLASLLRFIHSHHDRVFTKLSLHFLLLIKFCVVFY